MPKSPKRASPSPAKTSAGKATAARSAKPASSKGPVPARKAAVPAPARGKDAVPGRRRLSKTASVVLPPEPVPKPPPKVRKGGPTKSELKRYRETLTTKLRALVTSSKELAAEALQPSGGDFSVDHMADHGSDTYEQDFNLKLLEGEAEQLTEIRDALAKMDGKGELPFGLCEACSDVERHLCGTCPWIPPTRLDALPQARLCVQMKEREEGREKQ
jgi:RNA polymerase-binding transcription factor DksA